ncbi:SigE family RNA polymerase sigma factor [Ornithinimicrobium faecis]|uniref:SigE family RNA polymerase sigma factor n=1 Tax=Ornithinimicrobium faecis TaxID=2934158 RepID=A0ABY4YVE0_9MICO|nr:MULTISPECIES: SigE family RNA polymerase sigma factor [unclassified Ornithinimicrobium]USQ80695.1 SigE family RNA polymerase sigma factor [Ornithinimicrobium sp. HY1793]
MRLFGRSAEQGEIEAYVEGAMPRLVGLAYAMTGSKPDAEDLVQDTLATVITKWSRVSGAENVDAYVRRTMVNTLISKKRRKWTTEVVSHEAVTADRAQPVGAGVAQQVTDRDAVLGLLRQLPDRQRAVMALRFYEDLPDAQIAQALDCSEQAVRSAAHNAMKTLRRLLPAHQDQGVG